LHEAGPRRRDGTLLKTEREARPGFARDVSYEVNEPDAFALEEGRFRQKKNTRAKLFVITAGPARSQQVLREALAKGGPIVPFIWEDAAFVGALDAFSTARRPLLSL